MFKVPTFTRRVFLTLSFSFSWDNFMYSNRFGCTIKLKCEVHLQFFLSFSMPKWRLSVSLQGEHPALETSVVPAVAFTYCWVRWYQGGLATNLSVWIRDVCSTKCHVIYYIDIRWLLNSLFFFLKKNNPSRFFRVL